jgi:hypothetical protein
MKLIAQKNDAFRKTFLGGRVLLTRSVNGSNDLIKIVEAVRKFSNFTPDNDPYGEHDFGKVEVNDESYFFKIDYFDENYEFFKEDGKRVLTIMHCSEY